MTTPDREDPQVIADEMLEKDKPDGDSNETALALANTTEADDMKMVVAYARYLAASGYFEDVRSQAQAFVKVLAGREMGINAVASMAGIHIIEGKPVMGAGLMAQQIRRSGHYDYEVKALTDDRCEIEFYRIENGTRRALTPLSEFTLADAEQAGLSQKNTWKKYPRNMLFARALSNGVAWHCPDIFSIRVYTPEEASDRVELDAQGEIRNLGDLTPTPGDAKPAAPPREASERSAVRPGTGEKTPIVREMVNGPTMLFKWAEQELGASPEEVLQHLNLEVMGDLPKFVREQFEDDYRRVADEFTKDLMNTTSEVVEDAEPVSAEATQPPLAEGEATE